MFKHFLKLFTSLLLGCMALAGCFATSPLGRSQLTLMADGEMNRMGAEAFAEIKESTPIERDAKVNRYVGCVTRNLLNELPRGEYPNWEVVVFRSDDVNAFALPGGKVGVYTGLFKAADTQHRLAAVVGHEIGHVIARHSNERMSQDMLVNVGLAVGAVALSEVVDMSSPKGQLAMAALGLGAAVGILLPYGRTQESEADIIGLDLMAKAGFEPRESVRLWQNMERVSGGGGTPEFLSTHPSSETRINDLQANMGRASQYFASAKAMGKQPRCS